MKKCECCFSIISVFGIAKKQVIKNADPAYCLPYTMFHEWITQKIKIFYDLTIHSDYHIDLITIKNCQNLIKIYLVISFICITLVKTKDHLQNQLHRSYFVHYNESKTCYCMIQSIINLKSVPKHVSKKLQNILTQTGNNTPKSIIFEQPN